MDFYATCNCLWAQARLENKEPEHCTLQHTGTHCNTLQHINVTQLPVCAGVAGKQGAKTLQHTATHCNSLQLTAIHCNTLQHTAAHCNTLQHTAAHCNTLQHTAAHCNTLQHTATHCSSLQYAAAHCNTLQHTATFARVLSTQCTTEWRRLIGCLKFQVISRKRATICRAL